METQNLTHKPFDQIETLTTSNYGDTELDSRFSSVCSQFGCPNSRPQPRPCEQSSLHCHESGSGAERRLGSGAQQGGAGGEMEDVKGWR